MMSNNPSCNQYTRTQQIRPGMSRPVQQPPVKPMPLPEVRPSQPRPKELLLQIITGSKFAMVEANLYLDTHPNDMEALSYFRTNSKLYHEAMDEYAKAYGPLTLSQAHHCDNYWNWVNQPWPWQ